MSFFPSEGSGGIFAQGAFTIDPNSTPEMLKAKRAQLAALMPQYGRAKYVGEGIGQLATGIATGRKNKALDKFEGERRAEAANQFNGIMSGGQPRSSGPLSILGIAPQEQPATPEQGIADDAMKAIGKPPQGGNREAFIEQMMPHAIRVSQETGLDPRIIIAQAAQETGWGKSAPGNNYFGIKSHGKSGGNTFATNEVVDGQTVRINDSFRGYEGMGDSVDGYAQFLQENPRYRDMLAAGDLDGQLAALGKSGYATDPNYAQSVGSIARNIQVPTQGGSFAPGTGTQVAQAGGGPALNDLMMAAQNPWLSPQQKGVINSQIEQMQGQQNRAQDRQAGREDFLWKQQNTPQQVPAAIQELEWTARQLGLAPGSQEYKDLIRSGGGAGGTDYGLQPVYGRDKDGNVVVMQLGKNGQAVASALPEGVTPDLRVKGYEQAYGSNTGANEADMATGGQAAEAVAAGSAAGKASVEKGSELAEMERNMPGLLQVADELNGLAEDATYTWAGQLLNEGRKQLGLDPNEGALARSKYIAVVDNQVLPLLRQTFGAAFTAKEGDTLRATLGDPDKSPSEKKAVLQAFIEQKKRDLVSRGGSVPSSAPADAAQQAGNIPPLPQGLADRGVTADRWPAVWSGLSEQAKAHYRSLGQ